MMMGTLQNSRLLFLIQFIMINVFRGKATGPCEEDVISSCVNKTTNPFLYCVQTYGDVYNALASDKTYFPIAQALYPSKKPSSVQVYVTLYGANETENCKPAKYTWSKSCLYAAFPAKALQMLSLGSIYVASRTQKLNITIPSFCCTVSKDNRKAIIEGVLAALQDLAVMPRLQDPQLNTAECVIEGHEPDLSATGRSNYIRALLWLSFIFTVLSGPLLAIATLYILQDLNKKATSNSKTSTVTVRFAAMGKALICSSCLLFLVEIALFISSFAFWADRSGCWDIYVILALIFLEGLLIGLRIEKGKFSALLPESKQELCSKLLQIVIFLCANWTAYHFCWLMIGVMINPLWGVILLLFICVSVAAFIFAAYHYWYTCTKGFSRFAFLLCAVFVLSVWSLLVVIGLAGQSFYGGETADDIVKLVTLSVTTASFSWILSTMNKPPPLKYLLH